MGKVWVGAILTIALGMNGSAAQARVLSPPSSFEDAVLADFTEAVIAAKAIFANEPDRYASVHDPVLMKWALNEWAWIPWGGSVAWATGGADGSSCIYGGWLSQRNSSGRCALPPLALESETCKASFKTGFQCNPLLFGSSVCVDISTTELRNSTFSRCETRFKSLAGSRPYEFLGAVLRDPNQRQSLTSLLQAAETICRHGRQAGTPMCQKLLKKIADIGQIREIAPAPSRPKESACDACDIKKSASGSPLSQVQSRPLEAVIQKSPESTEELKKQHREVMAKIEKLVPSDKNSHSFVSLRFSRPDEVKQSVQALTQKRLCLELQIFKREISSRGLDFPLDCSSDCSKKPCVLPDFRVELIKNNGEKSTTFRTPAGATGILVNTASPLNYYIKVGDQYVLFKTEARVVLRTSPGPKLRQGDEKTPEGNFVLKSGTPKSHYFFSTHVDYENWEGRESLLGASSRNVPKGGDIKIHGTGGSDGCISIPNTEAALVAVWTNSTRSQTASIDIYPKKMTDVNLEQLLGELKKNPSDSKIAPKMREFWVQLKKDYQAQQAKVISGIRTIDDLLGQR